MSKKICIDLEPHEVEDVREFLCNDGEKVENAIVRIVLSAVKSRRMLLDLKYKG